MTTSADEIVHAARETSAEMRAGLVLGACGRDLALREVEPPVADGPPTARPNVPRAERNRPARKQ